MVQERLREYELKNSCNYKVLDLIEPYTKEFKPGMYKVEYRDKVFIFDKDYHKRLEFLIYVKVDYNDGTYMVNTGFPKLDSIVRRIMANQETYGLRDYAGSPDEFVNYLNFTINENIDDV